MKNRRFAVLFLCAALAFSGCAARQKNVTNLPANVTLSQVQQWDTAVANLDKIATSTSALRQAIIGLRTQGVITDDAIYGKLLTAVGRATQAQISAATFLQQYPKTWTPGLAAQLQQYLNVISAQLQAITQDGLVGIKNANSQQQVTQLIGEITTALNLILTLGTA